MVPQIDSEADEATARRTKAIYHQHRQNIFTSIDRLFASLMLVQWLAGIAVAVWISPKTWFGDASQTHIHVWAAVLLGGLVSLVPAGLALAKPAWTPTRYIIGISQMLMSALLIHLSGGRIETHFHVFGSLVILSFYRDWRVLIPATAVVAIDHYVRGVYWPQSVYGVLTAEPWRWLEHAAWVFFEVVFLVMSCIRSQKEMWFIARRTAQLETTNRIIEDKVVAISQEIHEREQAQTAMQEAMEEAERANRAKSEFLSRMSHELRTPMNAILGFAQLLELDALSARQREGVTHILKGGRHLLALINEVLDIARIESGNASLSSEPVRLREVLQEALDLIRPLAAQRTIELDHGDETSQDRHVHADRQRLKQVCLNLLSNAVKYNHPGGKVTLSCVETDPNQEGCPTRLRLCVKDTGPGILKANQTRLFSPFDRLGAEKSAVEGTGLGLALSKRLVETMGGSLGVESELGQGSTFWIELAIVPGPPENSPHLPSDSTLPEAGQTAALQTVLYIEDNLSNLKLIDQILARRPGIKLVSAMQGGLGIDLAREHAPSLILLDVNLPDMDGGQVLAQLRNDPRTSSIPVVVVSADAMHGQVDRLLNAGACTYITKPIDVQRFLEVVNRVLPCSEIPSLLPEAKPSPLAA